MWIRVKFKHLAQSHIFSNFSPLMCFFWLLVVRLCQFKCAQRYCHILMYKVISLLIHLSSIYPLSLFPLPLTMSLPSFSFSFVEDLYELWSKMRVWAWLICFSTALVCCWFVCNWSLFHCRVFCMNCEVRWGYEHGWFASVLHLYIVDLFVTDLCFIVVLWLMSEAFLVNYQPESSVWAGRVMRSWLEHGPKNVYVWF